VQVWYVEDKTGEVYPHQVYRRLSWVAKDLGISEQTLRNAFGRGVVSWSSGDGRWVVSRGVMVEFK